MPTLEARGVEIDWSERGEGPPVLLIHETAATGAIWDPLVDALSKESRAIAYDRRGWGDSSEPADYRRTTIEEQSEDAAALIESVADGPSVLCGAGVGAVIALDLLLRRSELVSAAVLIEPPLLVDASKVLAAQLSQSSAREVDSAVAPPHVGAPAEVASIVAEVSL